jgi:hypothetical protein
MIGLFSDEMEEGDRDGCKGVEEILRTGNRSITVTGRLDRLKRLEWK